MKILRIFDHPRGPLLIERRAFVRFKLWSESRGWPISDESVDGVDEMFIDGGGAIHVKEPVIHALIRGSTYSTFLRHAPFVVAALREKKPNHIPKVVTLGGQMYAYIMMESTALALADELDMQALARTEEIRKAEFGIAEAMEKAGCLPCAPCSCLSGKPYVDCHGR